MLRNTIAPSFDSTKKEKQMQGLVTKLVPQFRLDDFGLHFELLRLSLARWSLARLSLWWDTARPLGKDWKTARHRHHGKTQGTSLQRFARRSALVRGHQGSPGITRDHHRLSSRHNREMFHHFGARMLRISRMSVCILSGFQFSPRFFCFFCACWSQTNHKTERSI